MAKMKVKNLLKMVNSPEIAITVEDPEAEFKFKTYYINYCSSGGIRYDGVTHMECDSIEYLPETILERRVTYVSAYKDRVDISCYI